MKELSLRERLLNYMKKNHTTWISSGECQRLTAIHTKHTPRTAVRRLQELHEEGFLKREIRKNHTWYQYNHQQLLAKQQTPEHHDHPLAEPCKEAIQMFNTYSPTNSTV